MPTFSATTSAKRPMSPDRLCAALLGFALWLPVAAVAAATEPVLRASEQLDPGRLGKVSENERAVLRVEWRTAMTGAEEAQAVQQMLDSLRRMEDTTAQIGRLVRGIPAPKPAIEAVPAEPEMDIKSLAIGAAAAGALLLPLLWFGRRRTAENPGAPERIDPLLTAPAEIPPPLETAAASSSAEAAAHDVAPTIDLPLEPEPPPVFQTPAELNAPEPPRPGSAASITAAAPSTDKVETAPPGAVEIPPMEFTLEEADPESVAREHERQMKLQAMTPMASPVQPVESKVEPTLELAEIMLSMGLEQSAAQALLEFSEANPRQALYHWLKLLDIYRGSGHRKDFKETADKLRQHFNIQAEDWTRAGGGEAPTLEGFSRVAEHVQEIWSQPEECIRYLQHLLEDNREGSRAGFPQPVAEEILLLIEILKLDSPARQGDAGQRSTT